MKVTLEIKDRLRIKTKENKYCNKTLTEKKDNLKDVKGDIVFKLCRCTCQKLLAHETK